MNSAYVGWLAHVESDDEVVSVTLTPGTHRRCPEGGREFFESVLRAAGCMAPLEAGGAEPFLTNYFSGDTWEECWEARLLLTSKLEKRPALSRGPFDISMPPASELEPMPRLPVRVFADFSSRQQALKCRDALKAHASQARWDEIHFLGYRPRELDALRVQLVIDVATAERTDMEKVVAAAREAIRIAESHGASTRATTGERNRED